MKRRASSELRILALNCLSQQHGSSVRFNFIVKHLKVHFSAIKSPLAKTNIFKTLSHFVFQTLFGSYDILFIQKFNPITLVCILLGRLRRKYVWVDWDDLDHDMQKSELFEFLVKYSEKWGPKMGHLVSSHSKAILGYAPHNKTYFLPQTINQDLFELQHKEKDKTCFIKHAYHINPEAKLIGYMCTFTHGGMIDLPKILEIWQQIHAQDDSIYFILLGGGPFESLTKYLVTVSGLSQRVIITGFLEHTDIPRWLKQLDLAHIYLSPRPANYARVSLKLCEYLALGVPALGQCIGETELQLGQWVINANKEDMAQKSLLFLNDPSLSKKHLNFSWPDSRQSVAKLAEHIKKEYSSRYA